MACRSFLHRGCCLGRAFSPWSAGSLSVFGPGESGQAGPSAGRRAVHVLHLSVCRAGHPGAAGQATPLAHGAGCLLRGAGGGAQLPLLPAAAGRPDRASGLPGLPLLQRGGDSGHQRGQLFPFPGTAERSSDGGGRHDPDVPGVAQPVRVSNLDLVGIDKI